MIKLFAFNISSRWAKEQFDFYMKFLDNRKRAQIDRYVFEEDKLRSLYGDIMMRKLVCERMNIDNDSIIVSYNRFGKPYLQSHSGIHYNISHSGEWVICGIGNKELGIDIEKQGECYGTIAENIFTEQEKEELNRRAGEEWKAFFYDLWTLKESYVKCLGRGLNISLNTFGFLIQEGCISMLPNGELFNFKKFDCFSGYSIAVCSYKEVINDKIQMCHLSVADRSFIC